MISSMARALRAGSPGKTSIWAMPTEKPPPAAERVFRGEAWVLRAFGMALAGGFSADSGFR